MTQQEQQSYQRYTDLCEKYGFQPMPFELFQVGATFRAQSNA
jgi:hypothetical protein